MEGDFANLALSVRLEAGSMSAIRIFRQQSRELPNGILRIFLT
jgi:hypothetical protein